MRAIARAYFKSVGLILEDDDRVINPETGAHVADFLGVVLNKDGVEIRAKLLQAIRYVQVTMTIDV